MQGLPEEVQQVGVVIHKHECHSGGVDAAGFRDGNLFARIISEEFVEVCLDRSDAELGCDRDFPPECGSLVFIVLSSDLASHELDEDLGVG